MSGSADRPEVTAADMVAAAERIAEREGVTVEDVRERLRQVDRAEASERSEAVVSERSDANVMLSGERSCARPDCTETFVPKSIRHVYCSTSHRAAAYRERSEES